MPFLYFEIEKFGETELIKPYLSRQQNSSIWKKIREIDVVSELRHMHMSC